MIHLIAPADSKRLIMCFHKKLNVFFAFQTLGETEREGGEREGEREREIERGRRER